MRLQIAVALLHRGLRVLMLDECFRHSMRLHSSKRAR
jgi:hypothetical protein